MTRAEIIKKVHEKYKEILEEVKQGKSLNQIAKERKACRQNLYKMLRKRYPVEYNKLIYGEIVGHHRGYVLRKMPNRQTNRNECDITKAAKKFLVREYNCMEEIGIWSKGYTRRYTIDLYSLKYRLGIELCWNKNITSKEIIKRMKQYKKFCNDVLCVLLKDSSIKSKDRQYVQLPTRLKKAGIDVKIFDIATNTLS